MNRQEGATLSFVTAPHRENAIEENTASRSLVDECHEIHFRLDWKLHRSQSIQNDVEKRRFYE
jgi:hypothetical protein